MPKISDAALKEVQEAFRTFQELLETKPDPPYKYSTLNTYIPHAARFVKWLDDKVIIDEDGARTVG